jgi:hypothetical protein
MYENEKIGGWFKRNTFARSRPLSRKPSAGDGLERSVVIKFFKIYKMKFVGKDKSRKCLLPFDGFRKWALELFFDFAQFVLRLFYVYIKKQSRRYALRLFLWHVEITYRVLHEIQTAIPVLNPLISDSQHLCFHWIYPLKPSFR